MNPRTVAFRFGCTADQARALYRKNAEGLRQMQAKAARTGRKVGGYTAAELAQRADAMQALADQQEGAP
jgi:hypothetical protein